jgi:hypothetical protein
MKTALIQLLTMSIVFNIVLSIHIVQINREKPITTLSRDFSETDTKEYCFNLDSDTNEFAWRDNLEEKIGGKKEATIKFGRIDIETDKYVIEVEFVSKWHEGIGQAAHYAYETHKRGVIAIISTHKSDKEKINYIKRVCKKHGIEIFVLKNY